MRKAGLHIAFALIIALLAMPAVQFRFNLFVEKPLNGAFELTKKPQFSKEKWDSGEYQGQVETYLKDNTGFRNFLVRLQNQVDFSLFRQANAEGAVVGKNKQLYEYDYIRSWLALDYPGESFVEKKLRRTKYVQEYLKREENIDLVVVFEPGKASFYPEYLPAAYTAIKAGPSTYDLYLQKARELEIDFIDLHHYFLQLKEKCEYPLFPRYGTHWSVYGMQFAADSLLRLIEERRNLSLTNVRVDSVKVSSAPWDTDDDVLRTMNLLFPLKGEKLAYPVFSFDTLNPGDKPMVLVVADSYYWNIFNTRIPKHIFANEAFWYFNSLVYPDHYFKPTYTSDLNTREEAEKQEVIFLMITERFLHKFDWTFIDQLYALYTPEWLKDPVYENINQIMKVSPWYEDIINKSGANGVSLEAALITEGKFLFYQQDTARYLIDFGPEHFSKIISGDKGWMAHVIEKAGQNNVTAEEMLLTDALYVFRQDYPFLYGINRSMASIEEQLYSDASLLDSLEMEAAGFHWDPSSFVRRKAWQIYEENEIKRISENIRQDASWLEDVRQKALKNGISLEEMIRLDAVYMWEQELSN
jgi:hypothetical protein